MLQPALRFSFNYHPSAFRVFRVFRVFRGPTNPFPDMKRLLTLVTLLAVALTSALSAAEPLRVYIRSGPKSHGPGQHDHPRFLADWVPLLNSRGAVASGGNTFPTAAQLAATDVLVIHAQDGGNITGDDRTNLEAYLARGGGIVVIHAAAVSKDTDWYKSIIGGSWRQGTTRWLEAPMHLYFTDRYHAITRDASNWQMDDEIYYDMDLSPDAHVRAAALSLEFDDNLPSQKAHAVPALTARGFKATFYVNPAKYGFTTDPFWQNTVPALGHDYGVHTLNHRADPATVADDLAECARLLRQLRPSAVTSPLLAFARPGGKGAWPVSREAERALLQQNQLRSRDENLLMYTGQPFSELTAWTDALLRSGGERKICFHGVGGDYITVDLAVFTPFLDYLATRREQLWIAPHLAVHKYSTEFATARVEATLVSPAQIEVSLNSATDPVLYDQPLTLRTRVPAGLTRCTIHQLGQPAMCAVVDGLACYDAVPGNGVVILERF